MIKSTVIVITQKAHRTGHPKGITSTICKLSLSQKEENDVETVEHTDCLEMDPSTYHENLMEKYRKSMGKRCR